MFPLQQSVFTPTFPLAQTLSRPVHDYVNTRPGTVPAGALGSISRGLEWYGPTDLPQQSTLLDLQSRLIIQLLWHKCTTPDAAGAAATPHTPFLPT